jgi:hypothetical protein
MPKDITKFLKKSLLLILPFILLLGFVEYKLYKIPNGYNTKRSQLESQADSINVLVLGPSYTLYGVNPDYFECKGYNLANHSQSLFYDTQIALKYIDKLKNLKCVMVSISNLSFWMQMNDLNEEWRDYFYAYFFNIRYPEINIYDSRLYSLIMLYTVDKTFEYIKQNFKVDLSENLNKNGWLKVDTTTSEKTISESTGNHEAEYNDKIIADGKNEFENIYKLLDNFVFECKKRKVKVVFITIPTYQTYYKFVNPDNVKKTNEAVSKLCKKYNCEYFDYFKDSRFTIKDFKNDDHLNFIGAEKFSKILNEDIVSKLNCEEKQ